MNQCYAKRLTFFSPARYAAALETALRGEVLHRQCDAARTSAISGLARSVESMAKGTVKWFNEKKGFGFIVDPEVPTDIFVHFSVIQADGFKTLNEGETVEYELYQDEKGAKARNVVRTIV